MADRIAAGLVSFSDASSGEASAFVVDRHHIHPTAELPDFASYDVVAVGSPVHIFRPPPPVLDFVKRVPELPGRCFFVFVLYGTDRGSTGNILRRMFRGRGLRDIGYFTSRGADRFVGYLREGVLFSPDSPTEEELESAEAFGSRVAGRCAGGDYEPEPRDPPAPLLYALERFALNRFFMRMIYSRFFRVDESCIRCDICLRECPAGNISRSGGTVPEFGNACLMCGRCRQVCPVDAVHTPYEWPVNRLFMKINVRLGKRKGFPYIAV